MWGQIEVACDYGHDASDTELYGCTPNTYAKILPIPHKKTLVLESVVNLVYLLQSCTSNYWLYMYDINKVLYKLTRAASLHNQPCCSVWATWIYTSVILEQVKCHVESDIKDLQCWLWPLLLLLAGAPRLAIKQTSRVVGEYSIIEAGIRVAILNFSLYMF